MALEVFRRHQKKMLAVLALLAMIAFTLNLGQFGGDPRRSTRNPVLFTIDGNAVHSSDLYELRLHRLRANHFMQQLSGAPDFFGGTSNEELRDAYVLRREAERMGLPATPELANQWLVENVPGLSRSMFDQIYRESFAEGEYRCTDTELLANIAAELRLRALAYLPEGIDAESRKMSFMRAPGQYLVTPLDVFDAYREEAERVSVNAVPFSVDNYLEQVPEPTESEVTAYYDKFKDELPDPNRDTPGFKVPRRTQIEYVMVDADNLEDKYRAELKDEEVKNYYLEHQKEFPRPPRDPRDLPEYLFADDADGKLTPRTLDDFSEVRESVRSALARVRANDEVERLFGGVRTEVIEPFQARYDKALDERESAESAAKAPPLPEPKNASTGETLVKEKAEALGLNHVLTPLLTRDDAEKLIPIAGAKVGVSRVGRGQDFADHFFDPRSRVYEQVDLADLGGLRYMAWKLADKKASVPPLSEVRAQVVQAWKREKARGLAETDAKALAEAARTSDLKTAAGTRLLLTTDEVSKLVVPIATQDQPVRESEILQIPNAGSELRKAFFELKPGEVIVEPNAAKTTYYVMALNTRAPVELKSLFGPFGARQSVERRIGLNALIARQQRWLDYLRSQAKVSLASAATEKNADSPANDD
jgi:peptidyl-prolyl cis-trans isomerase D